MATSPTPEIAAAAHQVAEALTRVEAAAGKLATATTEWDRIQGNMTRLQEDRAGIVARRQVGNAEAEDGARLALIAADMDGLATLLTEAEAVVVNATTAHDQAKAVLAAARFTLQAAEDRAAEAALIEHAGRLDAAMLTAIGKLNELHRRRGSGMPPWGPSRALAGELRKLQAARHEL